MQLTEVKNAAKVCFESKAATLCLVGVSGSGKTSIWSQVYKELGFEQYVILRPALLADSADLIGLPEFEIVEKGGKAVKTTSFMRPKWLPFESDKTLIIVDEINRATKDVSNALFGLIEAEKPFIGEYQLPEGCKVVATCNPPTDNYAGVLDFRDSAWSSRLCFVKISPDLKVYTDYGRKSGTVSNVMLDFLNKNEKFFGTSGDFEVDMFFNKEEGALEETNTRSLSKASAVYNAGKDIGVKKNTIFELIRGIKGLEFTTAFMDFAENYATVVTLEDLLTDPEASERFEYTALSNVAKILEDLKHKMDNDFKSISDENIDNMLPFLKNIPLDTLKGFINYLVDSNTSQDDKSEFYTNFADKIISDEELDGRLDNFLAETEETTEETNESQEDDQSQEV
jgi:hypothetical protein